MWSAPTVSSTWSIVHLWRKATFMLHTLTPPRSFKQSCCPLSSLSSWRDSSTKYVCISKSKKCWVRSGIVSNNSITNFARTPYPCPSISPYIYFNHRWTPNKEGQNKKKCLNGTHIDCMQKKKNKNKKILSLFSAEEENFINDSGNSLNQSTLTQH